jgi:transposase
MVLARRKHNYTPEFREEAVKLVIETSRPIAQVARELGIVEGTLGNWVNVYRSEHASDEPSLTMASASGFARQSVNFGTSSRK